MTRIAPNATVERGAELGPDVEIGPGCYVGPKVVLGEGTRLLPNATVLGHTVLGRRNLLYPGCVVGAAPQDLKYAGADTHLRIGDDNVFRECVTVHTGTELGGGHTVIGNHNQFQVGAHVAHDVQLGNHCVLSNCVQLAGHVVVEDYVTVSGLVGVHQFVTIGRYAFVVGLARCTTDVPPFLIYGLEGTVSGVNVKGLIRWGFTEAETDQLKQLYRWLFPRRGRENENGGLRNIYTLIFSRKARRSIRSLSRRIQDAEKELTLDEHCAYLVDFLKRSVNDGVYGRHLESKRQDTKSPPPAFFRTPDVVAPEPVT